MKRNVFRLFLACVLPILAVLCMALSPMQSIKADEIFGNDTIVTFGLYSAETGQVEISQPDYFFDHIRYGLAHSIYNYNKRLYGDNANFPSEVSIFYERLLDAFPSDFFTRLSQYRWLLNVYRITGGRYLLCFNRVPGMRSYPAFERRFNLNETYTNEFLPDNFLSSFWVYNGHSRSTFYSYCPPYYIETSNSVVNSNPTTVFQNIDDVNQALQDGNVRSFCIMLIISEPSLTISTPFYNMYYNAYYSSTTLKAFYFINNWDYNRPTCLMSDFPVFNVDYDKMYIGSNYTTAFNIDALSVDGGLLQNMELSPYLISGYDNIPQATPTPTWTPTPIPTWTPYPTTTPFPPVNEIEGISQMMTLFTRKYEFNINGNVIGIRPLYLFVFTFLVGSIFKAIQGGDRN